MLLSGFYFVGHLIQKRHWPKTDATIISSSCLTSRSRTYRGIPVQELKCDIAYGYVVGGKNYKSDRIFHTDLLKDELWFSEFFAKLLVKKYRIGESIKIYYDPNNPQRSFIEFWEARVPFILLVGALLIFALAIFVS